MLPPSDRQRPQTKKTPTGPFNRKQLLDFLERKAKEEKDWDESVPYVAGQKRGSYNIHWASKETYHFFRATHIKMKISYNSPYQAHLKTIKFAWVKNEQNKVKSQEVIFQKSQKLLASRARSSV